MAARNIMKGTAPVQTPVTAQFSLTGANTVDPHHEVLADSDAEAAWTVVRVEAEALSEETLEHPSVPVREASMLGLTVARRAHSPTDRVEFEKLITAKLLDEGHFAKLSRYASALFFVRAQVERAPNESSLMVPVELVDKGDALRRRMIKVLGFYFDESTLVGAKLAKLKANTGYAVLSGDLVTLATLYNAHRARIEHTPEFYFATDKAEARRVAREIVTHLTTTDDTPTWTDAQQRVWTLFRRAYDEVTVSGRHLFRKDPDAGERYPTLHSLNVAARKQSAKADEPVPPTPPTPDPGPSK